MQIGASLEHRKTTTRLKRTHSCYRRCCLGPHRDSGRRTSAPPRCEARTNTLIGFFEWKAPMDGANFVRKNYHNMSCWIVSFMILYVWIYVLKSSIFGLRWCVFYHFVFEDHHWNTAKALCAVRSQENRLGYAATTWLGYATAVAQFVGNGTIGIKRVEVVWLVV